MTSCILFPQNIGNHLPDCMVL